MGTSRGHLVAAAVCAASHAGCAGVCPTPAESLEGVGFRAFHAPITYASDNLEALTAGPDFLSYDLLANGPSTWDIAWSATTTGPVTAVVGGVAFAGTGEWNEVECGNFVLNDMVADPYVDERGTSHAPRFGGEFVRFGEHLDGVMVWQESWTAANDAFGDFRAEVAVFGAIEP